MARTPKQNLTASKVDLKRVAKVGDGLRQLRTELRAIFPERRHLIEQILYGLLTQEHVLVHGRFGTGKSDILNSIFGVFHGAVVFPIGLTKFMTEANLIGIPNPKVMRDEGVITYNRDGGILDADFAELDELFDANAPLLRVLLGILNERQFKRGRQVEQANLHMAVASTNGNPQEELKKHPELGAVIDRFLFQCFVEYLSERDSRLQMYEKYLRGERPTVIIPIGELKYVSGIVTSANQITDMAFIDVYDQVIEAYCKATGKVLSDRRKCKLLQLVEANALLFGRYDVDFEDILAVRWGICMGGDDQAHDTFKNVAQPILEKAKANQQQAVDVTENELLDQLSKTVPAIPDSSQNPAEKSLVEISRELTTLRKKVAEVKPHLTSTEDKQRKLLSLIDERQVKVTELIQTP